MIVNLAFHENSKYRGISGDVVELVELLGPAVFQYLVNIEKARTPATRRSQRPGAYGRIWQGLVSPPLVRQDVEVEQSYSSNSTTSPTFLVGAGMDLAKAAGLAGLMEIEN